MNCFWTKLNFDWKLPNQKFMLAEFENHMINFYTPNLNISTIIYAGISKMNHVD